MAPHRSQTFVFALFLLIGLTWLGWSFRQPGRAYPYPLHSSLNSKSQTDSHQGSVVAPPEAPLLENSDLHAALCSNGVCNISPDASISYSRVEIDTVQLASFETPLLLDLDIPLPPFEQLTSSDGLQTSAPAGQRTTIQINTPPSPADASNLIFGAATNIDRLEDSLDQFSHWASNNGARIIALLPNTSDRDAIDRTVQKSLTLKLNLTVLTNDMEFDDRYFHLASLMYNYSTPSTQWASFIDDDTFFPSMNALQAMLSKYPSPTQSSYYVGALSEDFHQLFKWGFMGYGGGGVFVSAALLHQLTPHLDECAAHPQTGDARLARCIFSHTLTKLSAERDLYQIDLWGDASGFYEALRPQPVSVHHWKSWHSYDMANASKVAAVCGDACIFQKYRFADDWHLTNGFSLVRYSPGNERAGPDDVRMEKTWWDSQGGSLDMFLHSVAPLRLKDENKLQYLLEGAVADPDGARVRQFYVQRIRGVDERPSVSVVEVVWKKSEAGHAKRGLRHVHKGTE